MDINALVNLTARAWALPALALLHEGVPGRQAELLSASGAGRTAFGQSLRHLEDLGLLDRNPGHGHPLRPEFRLTPVGRDRARYAHAIVSVAGGEGDAALLRKRWTVPVLAVTGHALTFAGLKRALGPITDRALSLSLQQLSARQWIHRGVDVESFPPRPWYCAVNTGQEVARAAGLAA